MCDCSLNGVSSLWRVVGVGAAADPTAADEFPVRTYVRGPRALLLRLRGNKRAGRSRKRGSPFLLIVFLR